MKLNTFWNKLMRSAPDVPGAGGQAPSEQQQPGNDTVAGGADTVAAPDYGWMPEEYRKDGTPDLDGFKGHYQELIADQARRAEADADVPADGKYDFSLAADFDYGVELPEGVSIQIDTADPLFGEFGTFLKENNVSQAGAKGLTGLLAKWEAKKYATGYAEAMKEFETLGATEAARDARISTVQRALETKLPKDQAEAIMAMAINANVVKGLETILKPRGGVVPNTQPAGSDIEGLSGFELLKRANEQSMQK